MNLGSDLHIASPSVVFSAALLVRSSLIWHWQYTSRLGVDGTQHRFQASTLCRISEALQRQQGVKPHRGALEGMIQNDTKWPPASLN